MRTGTYINNWRWIAPSALVALAMFICPSTGFAANACTKTAAQICGTAHSTTWDTDDCDGDGFSDMLECQGFAFNVIPVGKTAASGKKMNGWLSSPAATTSITKLDVNSTDFLDPSKPDLFYVATDVTLKDVAGTTSPMGKAMKSMTSSSNGLVLYSEVLGVTTHLLSINDVGSNSTDSKTFRGIYQYPVPPTGTPYPSSPIPADKGAAQSVVKAALIKEYTCTALTDPTNCAGTSVGSTPFSVPTTPLVNSSIYTQKIIDQVNAACPSGKVCSILGTNVTNQGANGNEAIVSYWILQVIAHEMAHGGKLGADNKLCVTATPNVACTTANPARYPKSTANASTKSHYTNTNLMMAGAGSVTNGIFTIPAVWETTTVTDMKAVSFK